MRREMLEISVFLALVILYIAFRQYLAGRPVFIVPVMFLGISYLIYYYARDPAVLIEFGIRLDNAVAASKMSMIFFVPSALAVVGASIRMGNSPPPPSFYYLLVLYPLWGIWQQFVFQSFFHTRLIRLGLAPWSIFIVGIVFAAVHLPSVKLVVITLAGGVAASWIFYRYPNIIPLGVAHGILAAMVYYLILGKDVLASFTGSQ